MSRIAAIAGLAGSLLLALAATAAGFGTFGSPDLYNTDDEPFPVATGDFNRDGHTDVAVGNEGGAKKVTVFLNQGNGTLDAGNDFAAGNYPFGIVAADFNRNHKIDLAVLNYSDATVSILNGNGDGSFDAPVDHEVGTDPYALAVADINRDHRLDLLTADFDGGPAGTGTVSILLGKPGGFRARRTIPAGPYPSDLQLARMNRDRIADLVVLGYYGNVTIYPGKAHGRFGNPRTFQSPTASSYGMQVGDLNRDRRPDVVLGDCDNTNTHVMLNRGNGSLRPGKTYPGGACAYAFIAIGDIDRDGKADVAMPNQGGGIDILHGNGHGKLGPPQNVPAGSETYSVALARMNGDRALDLIVPSYGDDQLAVLFNQP